MPAIRRTRRPILLLTAIAVLLLLVLVHLLLPSLIRSQLEKALDPQPGQGTYLGQINLNLFTGLLVVEDVALGRPGKEYLRAARLVVDLDTLALFKGQLRFQQVSLNTGFWRLSRTADGGIDPGVPLPASEQGAESSSPMPSLLIESARLSNFRLLYRDAQSGLPEQDILVDHIDLKDFDPAAETPAPLQAALQWGAARLGFDGRLSTGAGLSLDGDIVADRLDMDKILRLARAAVPLSGLLSSKLNLELQQDHLKMRGAANVDGLVYQTEQQHVAMKRVDTAGLQLQLPLAKPDDLQVSVGSLALKGLQFTQGEQELQLAEGTLQGAWRLALAGRELAQQGLRLDLQGIGLKQSGQQAHVEKLALQLKAGSIALQKPEAQGTLAIDGIEFASPELGDDRLKLENLKVADWQWRDEQLRLAGTAAGAIAFTQYPARIAQISLGESTLSAQRLDLGTVTLRDLQGELLRKADGKWQLPVQSAPATKAASAPKPVETKGGGGPELRLAGVVLEGDNRLHLIDRSLKPAMDQVIRIETLRLGQLDNREPNKDTPLELALKPDNYSQFKLQAQLRPFAPSFYIDAKGKLEGLNMPLVNGMVANDLGNRFIKGELDDTFELNIAKDQLHMQNALTLDGLEVEPIEGKEGPPLSTAIALLENRDGQIKIDVPVDGDLSNPNFRVLGALNPIITKAVAGTAALAIQPFGSVLLLGSLLADQALKVSFAPVLFAPKGADLQSGMADMLKQLGGKLAERPKLRLRVCGVVSEADRSKNKKGEYLEPEKDLLALADRRAEVVRGVLEKAGVVQQQLRECRPEIDTDPNGKPRVDIRL